MVGQTRIDVCRVLFCTKYFEACFSAWCSEICYFWPIGADSSAVLYDVAHDPGSRQQRKWCGRTDPYRCMPSIVLYELLRSIEVPGAEK